jgi:hypothetical protein
MGYRCMINTTNILIIQGIISVASSIVIVMYKYLRSFIWENAFIIYLLLQQARTGLAGGYSHGCDGIPRRAWHPRT